MDTNLSPGDDLKAWIQLTEAQSDNTVKQDTLAEDWLSRSQSMVVWVSMRQRGGG